jgi:hypothetical protein
MARLYSVSKQSCAVKIFLSPNFPLIVVWTSWSWWQCWSLCSCASEVSPWSGILFVSLFLLFGISLTCLKKTNLHQIMTNWLIFFILRTFAWLDRKWFRSHVGGDTHSQLLKKTMYTLGEEAQMDNLGLGIPLTGNYIWIWIKLCLDY